ncbi:MAG: TfoX/Sxy family protein, partial [Pseudomonadota bacterium]
MDEDAVADVFAPFGPITTRRMFGGIGVYSDGVMIALVAFDELF